MRVYSAFKALKARLQAKAPVFVYKGQYEKGKGNTSYVVPAIYIQMPGNFDIKHLPRAIYAQGQIAVHVVTNAPHGTSPGQQAEANLEAHETLMVEVSALLDGFQAKDSNDKLLMSQLIVQPSTLVQVKDGIAFSVLRYNSEIY